MMHLQRKSDLLFKVVIVPLCMYTETNCDNQLVKTLTSSAAARLVAASFLCFYSFFRGFEQILVASHHGRTSDILILKSP